MQVKTISYKDAKPIIQFLKTINCSYIVIQLNNFTLIFKKKDTQKTMETSFV